MSIDRTIDCVQKKSKVRIVEPNFRMPAVLTRLIITVRISFVGTCFAAELVWCAKRVHALVSVRVPSLRVVAVA